MALWCFNFKFQTGMNDDPTVCMSTPRDRIEAKLGLADPPRGHARPTPPRIPDHELIRPIGRGAYGEVWIARNALGTRRAVKIVFREDFKDARPYEREFAGIRRFEPLSRANEGFVDILQVGRNDTDGWFYYVMELADDAQGAPSGETGPVGETSSASPNLPSQPDPREGPRRDQSSDQYTPHTLSGELKQRGRLPLEECLELGLKLSLALGHLHRHGLIHRDVKPSNIVFIGDLPKLADIGLVTDALGANTFVGTEGFVPPEGPTSPQADLYALGKVLYEAAMGKDRHEFPEPFTEIGTDRESVALMEFNTILLRACAPAPKARYASAEEMHSDLALLHSGGSVKRRHHFERQFRLAKQVGAVAIAAALLAGTAWFWQQRQTAAATRLAEEKTELAEEKKTAAEESRQRLVQLQTANGVRATDKGDPATAALWFAEVLRQSAGDEVTEQRERFRLGALLRYLPRPVGLLHLSYPPESANLIDGGKRVIAASKARGSGPGQGEIKEWELSSGQLVHSINFTNIGSVRVSPSGRWAVIADPAGNRLCEVSDELRFVTNLPFGGSGEILSAFSQDETKLAICGSPHGREVQLLDIPSGRLLALPLVHTNDVSFIAFDAAGRQLVTGTRVEYLKKDPLEVDKLPSGQARVWNATTGEPITGWLQSDEEVKSATFSSDGKALAIIGSLIVSDLSGSENHYVKVIDLPSGDFRFPPLAHQDTVLGAAFSPNGQLLATAGADRCVRLWDARSGELALPPFKLPEIAVRVCFSPDGRWLVAGCETEVRVWDARSGELVVPPLKQDFRATQLAFSPDGGCLMAATWSGSIHVWNLAAALPGLPAFPSTDGRLITSVAFSPDGRELVTTEATGELQVWDTGTGQLTGPSMVPQWEINLPAIFASTRSTRSADGRLLAVPSGDGVVRIWDAHTHQPSAILLRPGDIATSAEFSPVTNHLVTACRNGTARVWDANTGKPVTPPMNHEDYISMARYSPDGQRVATASMDGTARIWDALTGEPVTPPLNNSEAVYDVAFSPDGRKIATAGSLGTARIWDANTGQARSVPMKHLYGVVKVCFSPSGKQLLTTSLDRTARVWDVATGNPVTPSLMHNGFVAAGAFSPDGGRVITGSHDGTAHLWDAVTGEPLCLPFRHHQAIHDVAFSPDGRLAATASRDGTAQLWDLPVLEHPVDEITSLAQLYAGEKLGSAGDIEALDPKERAMLFERISHLLRGAGETSTDEQIRWHRRRLAECEKAMDWAAAEFHARRLLELQPHDPDAKADLDRIIDNQPPPRDPAAPLQLIDLSAYYNASLTVPWPPEMPDNHLGELPRGVQTLAGTPFDVRGVIQVAGRPLLTGDFQYPERMSGISIKQKLNRLQFLQAVKWGYPPDGTVVGRYLIHYANGRTEALPIIFGRDARDWYEKPGEPAEVTDAVIAWKGNNPAAKAVGNLSVRLFKRTWENPAPDLEVTSVDFIAESDSAHPFLVALTAE